MTDALDRGLPFITRKMLSFEQGVSFSLELVLKDLSAETIYVRGITKEGPFTYSVIPVGSGSSETFTFPIPDIPTFVSVTSDTVFASKNTTYAWLRLSVNGNEGIFLTQGYVNFSASISWPYQQSQPPLSFEGFNDPLTVSNPAAGADWSYTIPATYFARLRAIRMTYVASANAASRRVAIDVVPAGTLIAATISAPADILISQTRQLTFADGLVNTDDQTSGFMTAPLPRDFMLPPGSIIRSVTKNMNATDQFSAIRLDAIRYLG